MVPVLIDERAGPTPYPYRGHIDEAQGSGALAVRGHEGTVMDVSGEGSRISL